MLLVCRCPPSVSRAGTSPSWPLLSSGLIRFEAAIRINRRPGSGHPGAAEAKPGRPCGSRRAHRRRVCGLTSGAGCRVNGPVGLLHSSSSRARPMHAGAEDRAAAGAAPAAQNVERKARSAEATLGSRTELVEAWRKAAAQRQCFAMTPKDPGSKALLPADFPHRDFVTRSGATMRVPRHVVRIDIEDGTRGWQVRYRGRTRFFSDRNREFPFGTPQTSLARAIDFLADIYEGPNPPLRSIESRSKLFPTGIPGVRIRHRMEKSGTCLVTYVEVDALERGSGSKRFYVGTSRTATEERLLHQFDLAVAYRSQSVAELVQRRARPPISYGRQRVPRRKGP
jgi:hypothetical protein